MSRGDRAPGRKSALIGGGGLALAVCCVAVPAIFGVAVGATLGNALDVGAAVLIAAGVALALHQRRTSKGKRC